MLHARLGGHLFPFGAISAFALIASAATLAQISAAEVAHRCLIQERQAGPVRVGMTVEQARAVLHGATLRLSADDDGAGLIEVRGDGVLVMDLYPSDDSASS